MSLNAIRLAALPVLLVAIVRASTESDCSAAEAFSKATTLLGGKQFNEAARVLDPLRHCMGLAPLQKFQLGWLLGRARRFEPALEMFRQVPADVPDRSSHDYAVALSQFELSDYKAVIDTFKAARTANTLDENSANLMAVSYSKLNDQQDAYRVLSDQLQKRQGSLDTYLNLVTVCAEGGDYNGAAKAAGEAVRLFPQSPEPYFSRGAANTLLGKTGPAYEDFLEGAKLAPQRADARFFLALTKYKEGQYTDAVSILEQAMSEGLRDSDLHYLLAECLTKTNPSKPEPALEELGRAIAIAPRSEAARTLRGKLLLDSGHAEQAIADLELAARENPNSRSASYTLARAYRAAGREPDARKLFAKLREQPASTLDEMSDERLAGVLSSPGKKAP